jgi:molybdopterin synthase catalytic subunit
MILITSAPIDTDSVLRQVASPQAGAVVLFLGAAREFTGTRQTAWLEYECYGTMAEKKLAELEAESRRRWPLIHCAIVHRMGRVPVGECSVAVAASSPHRQDAFAAAAWLIDTLKQVVPIWKQEQCADGTAAWVHPGLDGGAGRECGI